ncbi:MAG: UvrD-helicase domain-containing protein [Bacilli bacterium]|nr:UvrD-helicase domain-containing protein [Bacilli bacterium]
MDTLIKEAYDLEMIKRSHLLVDKRNVFVVAGAGAGKSTSLVSRIVGFLGNGEKPDDFVAISFTNKAAEELRSKIITELNRRIMDEEYLSYKDNLEYALNHIDLMHISTIHKFCNDILRENSIYANLNPSFKVLVDEDDLKRKKDIFDAFFKKLSQKDIDDLSISGARHIVIKKDMENIFNVLTNYVDKIELKDIYNHDFSSGLTIQDIENDYYEYFDFIKENMAYMVELSNYDENPKKVKVLNDEAAILITGKYEEIYGDKKVDFGDILKYKFVFPFNGNKYRKNVVKDEYQEFKANFEAKIKVYNERKDAYRKDYSVKIVGYAYKAYLEYLDYIDKDKDNISNNQCIYLVAKLLKENKDVLAKLKKHYKHIYIDEYQDTDHLQRDIALLLTREDDKFIDNALYLVGDPKQSIYRFRGAEPDVYFDTMKLYDIDMFGQGEKGKSNAQCYNLNINFRSNNKIIEYVNDTFRNICLTSEAYNDMLVAKKNIVDEADYLNEDNLIGFYNHLNKDPETIAKLILYLVNNKKVRDVTKDKNGEYIVSYKPVEFKDIMVLMQNHNAMSDYVQEFTKYGIPTKVAGESNFSAYQALRSFVNLFASIACVSDRAIELASSVFKNIYKDKFNGLTIEQENDLVNKLYEELLAKTNDMSAYGQAIYLANHLEWLIEEDSINEGFIINNIRSKLFQMIEEVFASDYYNGNELDARFNDYVNNAIEYESLIEDNANCVSIINTHKAKGLEAKIVIWVALDKVTKEEHPATAYKGGILYLNERLKEDHFYYSKIDLMDEDAARLIQKEEDEELARLEYVIATRPKEAFIYAYDDKSKGLFFEYENDIYGIKGLRSLEAEETLIVDEKECSDYQVRELDFSNTHKGLTYISPSKLENKSKIRYQEFLKHQDEDLSTPRPQSAIVGTIMHKAFELMVKDNNHDVDASVNKALELYASIIEDYDNLFRFIHTCAIALNKYYSDNNIYKYDLYSELNYSYLKDKDIISNGSIDLLAISGKDAIIFDYKSDEAVYISDEEVFKASLIEKYKVQLDEYENALNDLGLDVDNVRKVIIYFRNYDLEKASVDLKTLEIKGALK